MEDKAEIEDTKAKRATKTKAAEAEKAKPQKIEKPKKGSVAEIFAQGEAVREGVSYEAAENIRRAKAAFMLRAEPNKQNDSSDDAQSSSSEDKQQIEVYEDKAGLDIYLQLDKMKKELEGQQRAYALERLRHVSEHFGVRKDRMKYVETLINAEDERFREGGALEGAVKALVSELPELCEADERVCLNPATAENVSDTRKRAINEEKADIRAVVARKLEGFKKR